MASTTRIVIIVLLTCFRLHAQTNTMKPWTYWWWMGGAVTEEGIRDQLGQFAKAGLGGVHIIPIYGVKGEEQRFTPFLSSRWNQLVQFTVAEGKRLGMGVDMSTGTGWPFGGPAVSADDAAKKYVIREGRFVALPTGQAVKRAAPGGEGKVVDHFSKEAVSRYLDTFSRTYHASSIGLRAMYNDSYEVYGANWTGDFLPEFEHRRGYKLENQIGLFTDSTDHADAERVRMDYHETISDLLYENFARTWTTWSRSQGYLTRSQAHGSPGNLLDLYAQADIPETESFGTSRFNIPGLRIDPDYEEQRFGKPHPLAMKFASSSANFHGKKLVSSETGTWLANHFKVSLSQVKPQVDELFTAGINHIFYHGITYSPKEEAWPGWLFYASTNFGQSSHFWNELPQLNKYIERCEAILQQSEPDNDILVYFPIHDLWAKRSSSAGGVHLLEVHHTDQWLLPMPFGKVCSGLLENGFSFDYVSDRQLMRLGVTKNGQLNSGHRSYKVLVVPATRYMPLATLQQIRKLADDGARVIFSEHLPASYSGYGAGEDGGRKFASVCRELTLNRKVVVSDDIISTLRSSEVPYNSFGPNKLSFIKKKRGEKSFYFIANLDAVFREGWVRTDFPVNGMRLYDPLNDSSRDIPVRTVAGGQTEVFINLLPGQSCFLFESDKRATHDGLPWQHPGVVNITGNWTLRFREGLPALPADTTMDSLVTWTSMPGPAFHFYGEAVYTTSFHLPDAVFGASEFIIDLGDVRESARVRINGQELGTAWSIPFRLRVNKQVLKKGMNTIDITVRNLSANYMRLRDQQSPAWKKFYDINIVDITYRPFNASTWLPIPSGLLGPVRLEYKAAF